jgi:hypothetical protein
MVRQSIMVETSYSSHSSMASERETERGLRQDTVPKDMLPVTYLLQPGSTSEVSITYQYCQEIMSPSVD